MARYHFDIILQGVNVYYNFKQEVTGPSSESELVSIFILSSVYTECLYSPCCDY